MGAQGDEPAFFGEECFEKALEFDEAAGLESCVVVLDLAAQGLVPRETKDLGLTHPRQILGVGLGAGAEALVGVLLDALADALSDRVQQVGTLILLDAVHGGDHEEHPGEAVVHQQALEELSLGLGEGGGGEDHQDRRVYVGQDLVGDIGHGRLVAQSRRVNDVHILLEEGIWVMHHRFVDGRGTGGGLGGEFGHVVRQLVDGDGLRPTGLRVLPEAQSDHRLQTVGDPVDGGGGGHDVGGEDLPAQ